MRRFALILPVAAACSFDATGFGEPPVTSAGPTTASTGLQGSSGGGGETTAATVEETLGVSGSGSMTASGTTGVGTTGEPGTTGEVTTEPGSTTTGGSSGTTGGTTGQPCETMMVWVDGDGDGYGDPNMPKMVCVGEWQGYANNPDDCNDTTPAARPGEKEVCDQLDNDCDGMVDEYDAAANKDGCNDCAYRVRNDRLYYFCNWDAQWQPARQFCQKYGLDLATDSDMGEHDWIVGQADAQDGWGQLRWIGGKQDGNAFKWVDGTTVPQPDPRWFGGEPNNQGIPFDFGADCLVLVSPGPMWGKLWLDYTCDTGERFICEGPLQ